MNIYKISQNVNTGYCTYEAAVVCAENEEDARTIHPDVGGISGIDDWWWEDSWVSKDKRHLIKVELLGKAVDSLPKGLILGSYVGE